MPPKENAPLKRATQVQSQRLRAQRSRGRLEEERSPAMSTGSHRRRRVGLDASSAFGTAATTSSIISPSNGGGGSNNGFYGRTSAIGHSRREIWTSIGGGGGRSRRSSRSNTAAPASITITPTRIAPPRADPSTFSWVPEQRSAASRKSQSTPRHGSSGTCVFRPCLVRRVVNAEVARGRNVSTSSGAAVPDRLRNQQKKTTFKKGSRVSGSSHERQVHSPKKKLSRKSHMVNITDTNLFQPILSSDQIFIREIQNKFSMIMDQVAEKDANDEETFRNGKCLETNTSVSDSIIETEEFANHCDSNPSVKEYSELHQTPLVATPKPQTPIKKPYKNVPTDKLPSGWERVQLSLQVQMSPLVSPSGSSTNQNVIHHIPHNLLSCKNQRTFQTTSEVLVHPIFAQQHHIEKHIQIFEKSSDPGVGSGSPVGNNLMREILEYKNESQSFKSNVNESQVSEVSGHLFHSNSIENPKTPKTHHPQKSGLFCDVDKVFNPSNEVSELGVHSKRASVSQLSINSSEIDTSSACVSQKDSLVSFENNSSSHTSSENIVTELQLNQDDIVKMAYEIIDIVSNMEMSKSSHSNLSDAIMGDEGCCQQVRSFNMFRDYSESGIPSTCSTESFKRLRDIDVATRAEVHQLLTENLKPENTEHTDVSVADSSDEGYHDRSSAEDISIINSFKLCKDLATQMIQNKQVHDILNHFGTKHEIIQESNKSIDLEKEISSERNHGDLYLEYTITCAGNDGVNECANVVCVNKESEKGERTKVPVEKGVVLNYKECISKNIVCSKLQERSGVYDESTASEMETEKSQGVESELGAEDGDDEATGSASETVDGHVETRNSSTEGPTEPTTCQCKERQDICPRHPSQNDQMTQEGTCQCERFNDVCTEADSVNVADSQKERSGKKMPLNGNQNYVNNNNEPSTSNIDKSASWVPWVTETDGPGIPDFNPEPTDAASTLTIPPKTAQNTLDLRTRADSDLSVFGSGVLPPWIPEKLQDEGGVPDTITEFHWMPDGLRGFSSTILNPEIPDELKQFANEERPMLYTPRISTPDSSVSGFLLKSASGKQFGTTPVMINPDAPAEVPQGPYGGGIDIVAGGNIVDVLASAMEKSISPLKAAIDDLKTKIDRMETTHIAALRPDIVVGVTSVPTCSARSGQSDASDVHSPATCVPPFGLYILHQRSSLVGNTPPLSANIGGVIESSGSKYFGQGKSPLPCGRCVDKLQAPCPVTAQSLSTTDQNFTTTEKNTLTVEQKSSIKAQNSPVTEQGTRMNTQNLTNGENSDSSQPPASFENRNSSDNQQSRGSRLSQTGARLSQMSGAKVNSQSDQEPSNNETSNICTCHKLDDGILFNQENDICPKCHKCRPSSALLESESEPGPSSQASVCLDCCNPAKPLHKQAEEVKSVNIQNTVENNTCGTCKTCVSNKSSTDSALVRVVPPRCPSGNIPCYKCCTGPLLKNIPRDYPWYRLKACPGCRQCPYPPPCPPAPPQKPRLSHIAQMYLDMSRAKHDWSDISDTKDEKVWERPEFGRADCKCDEETNGGRTCITEVTEENPQEEMPEDNIHNVAEGLLLNVLEGIVAESTSGPVDSTSEGDKQEASDLPVYSALDGTKEMGTIPEETSDAFVVSTHEGDVLTEEDSETPVDTTFESKEEETRSTHGEGEDETTNTSNESAEKPVEGKPRVPCYCPKECLEPDSSSEKN